VTDTPASGPPPLLNRLFPEKRIFVKSDRGTRFVRLGPRQHVLAGAGVAALVAWSFAATALVVMDLVHGAGAREQALSERMAFESRIEALAADRDRHRLAALDAQDRYAAAVAELAALQDRLIDADLRQADLEAGRDALRRLLAEARADASAAERRLAALETSDAPQARLAALAAGRAEAQKTADFLADALARTAAARDAMAEAAETADARLARLEQERALRADSTDRILARLEEAVTLAMEPLGQMFRDVGLPPEQVLDDMRRQYSGQGGPLTPIAYSAKGSTEAPDPTELRANAVLGQMDRLNLYRLAVDKVPFAVPVTGVRRTSGFGYRRDPMGGGTRMHEGLDWAGPYGTAIRASADGVVVKAGWQSGYGRVVTLRHAFGIETRFAHLARIDVRVGQRVSRGEQIGAMGNSGRSTGTHLHYEVHVGGKPVDPMTFIKAARDVL